MKALLSSQTQMRYTQQWTLRQVSVDNMNSFVCSMRIFSCIEWQKEQMQSNIIYL